VPPKLAIGQDRKPSIRGGFFYSVFPLDFDRYVVPDTRALGNHAD